MARRVQNARLIAVAVIGILVLACGTAPTPQPSGSGALNSDGPIECAIAEVPGPDNAPPADAEIDTRDLGPGLWHLCLTAPTAASAKGTAWCRWDAARNQVQDVSGLPQTIGTVEYDAFIDRDGDFEIHLTDRAQGGTIANYRVAPGNIVIPGPVTRQNGLLHFEATLVVDPGSGPTPGAPPVVAGMLRWVCVAPPSA